MGNVAVAISWADYFRTLLDTHRHPLPALAGDRLPDGGAAFPGLYEQRAATSSACPIVFNLLAVLIVALITVVLVGRHPRVAPASTPAW